MEKNEVLALVNEVFIDALDNEDIKLTEATTANDVEEWDSLSHIQLIVAVEKKFKIRFTSGEIHGFKNVGDMCDAIIAKLG
ncbi:MAG: acyl carrier protein [Chitinophagaceae bacterium]|nr:acyl carrier protein [Chitinophagaceae bacterium]